MRYVFEILLTVGLMLTTAFASGFDLKPAVDGQPAASDIPVVHVDPSNITDLGLTPLQNFTIQLKISNVTDLYGFDIRLSWNASVLNYTSHIVKIPVEDYPDGVLHKPVLPVKNEANATTGTYVIVYSSLTAPSFNGSGTVFEMTFTVIGIGECPLTIYNSDLADSKGQPINHTVEDGYFSNLFYDIAVLNVTPSSTVVFIGETVNITVVVLNNGTTRNENFNVTTYYSNVAIQTKTIPALPPHTEETLTFYWNTSTVSPGDYTISAEATVVPGENSTENNRFEDGVITLAIEPIHDIAVTALTPLKTLVFKGYCLHVNVTIENQGNFPETFNVTLRANNAVINRTQVYLERGTLTTVEFAWETTEATEYEDYSLNVTADQVYGENDTNDNTFIHTDVDVVHPGDFDSDGDVDIFDIVLIAGAYGSKEGDPEYDSNLDVNCDGEIDIFDIVQVTPFYGYERE